MSGSAQRKRQPTPEELGLVDPEEFGRPSAKKKAETAKRQPTPEELGLVDVPVPKAVPAPVPRKPMAAPANDNSPEALGLVDADEDWVEWGTRQASAAVDVVSDVALEFLDALGFDPPPKPANPVDTSRRVPLPPEAQPKATAPGKLSEEGSLLDWAIPDAIERPLRDAYDYVENKVDRNIVAGADRTIAAVVIPPLKTITRGAQWADRKLKELLGSDPDTTDTILPGIDDTTWSDVLEGLDADFKHFAARYEANRVPDEERDVVDVIVETLPSLPVMLVEYGLASAVMGPVFGFAAVDAATAAGNDEDMEGVIWAALKGAAMGKLLESVNVLSRPLRAAVLGPAGAGLAWAEGGKDVDIAASGLLFGALGSIPKSGPVGVRYLREHGVKADLRDMGGHLRDLLTLGYGNGGAKREMESSANALKRVKAKHKVETTEDAMRWQDELATARKPQEGDVEGSVGERVSAVNAAREQRLEQISMRQFDEELPYRQKNDHDTRRYNRAKDPFSMSWQAAPYMRALHSAERSVVVAHVDGAKILTKVDAEVKAREADGMKRASELRATARATKDPEGRRRLEQAADHAEDETRRITFKMRNDAEDAIDFRIEMAESRASVARYELAGALGKHSRVDGRRAKQMAADRDRGEAYRSGLRVVSRGARRARVLLKIGDDIVTTTRARLQRNGVKPEGESKAYYDKAMDQANGLRENYRQAASVELYSATSRADMRISFANARFEAAMQPENAAGRRAAREKRNAKDEDTTPDDAKAPDKPGWDPAPKKDPVPLTDDFYRLYKSFLDMSIKDPKLLSLFNEMDAILSKISRPEDVLPALNKIAHREGYDPPSRRGKQTAKLRKEAAEKLGMTEEQFLNSPYGRAFSDAELEAIVWIVDSAYARMNHAYEVWRKTGSENARGMYEVELYRFMMIWERLRGAAAESGRSLRMFRTIKGKYGSVTGRFSDAEYAMIMARGSPKGVMDQIAAMHKGAFNGLIEFYINGLLSSFQTAIVNVMSGLQMLVWRPLQTAFAATWGIGRQLLYKFIGSHLMKPIRAVYRDLRRAKVGMFGTAKEKADLASREYEEKHGAQAWTKHSHDRIHFGEIGAYFRGMVGGIFEAVGQFFKTLFTGDRYLGEANWGKGMGEHIPWWLGGPIVRIPGRVLQAIDDFFKVLMYRAGVRAHAYRTAWTEWEYSAKWDKSRTVRKRYQELAKHPTQHIRNEARKEALQGTFQNEVDPLVAWVPGATAKSPVFKVLVPFSKTLLNTVEFIASGTPAGALIFKRSRDSLLGRNGKAAQDMAVAHMVMVSGTAWIVYMWALEGGVSAPYRKGEKERTMQGIDNIPPGSIRIPGTNKWMAVNRIDPMGGLVALGGAAAAVTRRAELTGDDEQAASAWQIFLGAMITMTSDRAGLRGLMEFVQALQGGPQGNDPKALERWATGITATVAVPQAFAVKARTDDPRMVYANTLMEKIWSRIPGQREQLWGVRNLWGDQIIGYDSYGGNDSLDLTMPVYWGKRTHDPASRAMRVFYQLYDWAPGSLDRSIAGRRLTPEEYDYYATQAGKYAYEAITNLTKSAEWQRAEQLDKDLKGLRDKMELTQSSKNWDAKGRKAYFEAKKQFDAADQELKRLRYALLQRAKNAISAARKKARYDTVGSANDDGTGKFREVWDRRQVRDDAAKSGETPSWFDNWAEAEGPVEEWAADEQRRSDQHDQKDAPP